MPFRQESFQDAIPLTIQLFANIQEMTLTPRDFGSFLINGSIDGIESRFLIK